MGLILIVIGLVLWLATGLFWLGLVLIILGVLLLFAPWPGAYGYSYYHGRRRPPP